jgi:threonine/homoserine/homoserine lactone efflux protein
VTVAAAGLAAFFAAVPVAFTTVRLAGAAYLIFLGVQAIRHRGSGVPDDEPDPVPGHHAYLRGLLTNLLNPKMVTFTIAFPSQFKSGHVESPLCGWVKGSNGACTAVWRWRGSTIRVRWRSAGWPRSSTFRPPT